MEKHTGQQLNQRILEELDALLEPHFRNGEIESRAESHPEIIDVKNRLGEDCKIRKDQEPYYRAIMALIDALTFEETLDNQIFEVPGLKVTSDSKKTMYIPISKIESVANIIEADFGSTKKFEELTGIKLPNQIHQYRSDRRGKMDGFDITAPSPKLVSESNEEYEQRLRDHYGEKFVAPTVGVPVGEEERRVRVAYPHETTDYRNGTARREGYESESYNDYKIRQTTITERTVRPRAGERIRVTESELAEEKIPFLTRLKAKSSLVGKALEKGRFWKGVALVGGAFLGAKYIAIPLLLSGSGLAVVGLGGAAALYSISKAYFKRLKKKRDKAKAEAAEEREETETPPESVPPSTPPTAPPEEEPPVIDPDAIDFTGLQAELLESQRAYTNYQNMINNLERQLANAGLSDEEKTSIIGQIESIRAEQRKILDQQKTIIDAIYNGIERGRSR